MQPRTRLLRLGLVLPSLFPALPWAGDDGPRKLSGPMPFGLLGDVADVQITRDGTRAVYLADQDRDEHQELYSRPADLSAPPVKLNDPLIGRIQAFVIAPDGSRVVYNADRDVEGVFELYSVSSDGSSSPVKLSAPMVPGGNVFASGGIAPFLVTPDSARVLFVADAEADEVFELYGVPIDGSSVPVKLSGTLVEGGDVGLPLVSPDGQRAVYLADAQEDEKHEVFSVLTDGSAPSVQLSLIVSSYGDADQLRLTPDGARVLYRADQTVAGREALYSVPIGGGVRHELNPPLESDEYVFAYALADDGSRVVFEVLGAGNARELYVVPSDGSAPAVRVNGQPGSGLVVSTFGISPDGSWVVYAATRSVGSESSDLYGVPSDASAPPVRLNGPDAADDFHIATSLLFTADSARVLYVADQITNGKPELFAVPVDGSALPIRLNDPLPYGLTLVGIGAGGTRAVFTSAGIYSVPVDGSAPALLLHDAAPWFGIELTADGTRAFYVGLAPSSSTHEAFITPIDGSGPPVVLNGPLTGGPAGDVTEFQVSSDGRWAVYRANQDDLAHFELFTGEVERGQPVRLHPPLAGHVSMFAIGPDGTFVVYEADQEVAGQPQIYRVPIDGSQPPLELDGSLSGGGPRISPDGSRAVFLAGGDLHSVASDGSQPPVLLGDSLVGVQLQVEISPDSSRVVVRDGKLLYTVPIDGTGPMVLLSSDGGTEGIGGFRISPDSARVVYQRVRSGPDELYSAAIDGIGAPLPLGASGARVPFAILPDSSAVVVRADLEVAGRIELFRIDLPGGGPPVKLSGPLPASGDVTAFELTPDGARVAYRAGQRSATVFELFSARTDGLGAPILVSGPLVPLGDVDTFLLTADSKGVLYRADQEEDGVLDLYSVPLDRSSEPRRLSEHVPYADVQDDVVLRTGGHLALFRADAEEDEVFELYAVDALGLGRPRELNGPLDLGGDVQPDARLAGEFAVYRADQDLDGVFELYASRLARTARQAGPPRPLR